MHWPWRRRHRNQINERFLKASNSIPSSSGAHMAKATNEGDETFIYVLIIFFFKVLAPKCCCDLACTLRKNLAFPTSYQFVTSGVLRLHSPELSKQPREFANGGGGSSRFFLFLTKGRAPCGSHFYFCMILSMIF